MSTTDTPLLTVENLRTYIPTRRGIVHAVDGVSFDLHLGKTLAVVGESGCGKSVLCRTILGLLPEKAQLCSTSSLQYKGQDLIGLKEGQYNQFRATQIAMIFQDPLSSLHPVMTVGRQIGESLRYHLNMTARQAREKTIGLIGAVGLPEPARCIRLYPHQLSGGMRQRIAIAIALACKPQLLIADEPTTALDVTVQAGILVLLNNLQAEHKMAIILVTHDLGVASNIADYIAVMYAGKIVEIGATSELFNHPSHPYTQALMDAIPKIDQPPHTPLRSIKGQPCDLVDPPSGCRFSARCPRATDQCRRQEPPLCANPSTDHRYACWHPLGGLKS